MSDHFHKKVIVIAGPTASGKTALSIRLAKHFQTEIISCDSRQCYREMNIGTAAPSEDEMQGVKHYFIRSHSIMQPVSAGTYKVLATEWLEEIFKKKDVAIITGGTGLYLQTLTEGIHDLPTVSENTRNSVKSDYASKGLEFLQSLVKSADPEYFAKTNINNPARLMRAAEIIRETGLPYSSFIQFETNHFFPYKIEKYVIDIERTILYERINDRVDKMIETGLVDEVRMLLPFRNLQTLQTVGYTELFDYFDGNYSLEFAIGKIKQHSRNYAKRQLTWFRNKGAYLFANPSKIEEIITDNSRK